MTENDFKISEWEARFGIAQLEENIIFGAYAFLCNACDHECEDGGCETIQRIKNRLKGVLE